MTYYQCISYDKRHEIFGTPAPITSADTMTSVTALSLEYSETLLVHFRRTEQLRTEALHLTSIDLNTRQLCDLESLLNRSFYPLTGYLDRADYDHVLADMTLADGSIWPMPICLDVLLQSRTVWCERIYICSYTHRTSGGVVWCYSKVLGNIFHLIHSTPWKDSFSCP